MENYPQLIQIFGGFLLGLAVSFLAYRAAALDMSGALTATLTGGIIFGFGGIPWAVLLLTFFISSSLLSRAFRQRKGNLSEKFAKSSRRDWGQVLANGALGALLALAWALNGEASYLWWAFLGAMASVNADTWATELGVLNPVPPRSIISGRRVAAGTSGGVSAYGTLASLGGGGLIGLAAALSFPASGIWRPLLIGAVAGLAGSLFDSLLGATVQAMFYCPTCDKETERHPMHTCATPTRHLRGWRWLNNDWVNFIASLIGAGTAILLQILTHTP